MPLALTLARGALASPLKRRVRAGAELPATRLTGTVHITPARLTTYARICGFPETGPLPLPYPHVLGFPLAMRLMASRRFPLPLLGLVHTRIEIVGHRPLHPGDAPELTVYAERLTPHRRGTEVTMVTEARLAGELVWESRSGYLARHRTASDAVRPTDDPGRGDPDGLLPAVADWQLPAALGRRYGAASGDRNPIHLHPLTARLFGFPRAIAHGMWTFARCLAETGPGGTGHARAEFKAPVLLPATVTYAAGPGGPASPGTAFQLRSGERIHLSGRTSAHPS